jgi:hypothetical protein
LLDVWFDASIDDFMGAVLAERGREGERRIANTG